ncbi:hypothetical protein C8J57DRAFT_1039844, partial [Mycena rebaudengoi]
RLQAGWRSPVYSFYKKKVVVGYANGRKYHFFECNNPRCRNGKKGGVKRYLDKKDLSSTGNLLSHARACFGQDAVDQALSKTNKSKGRDGKIYSAFARLGQKVKSFSYRPQTAKEIRATVVRWVTENNRPANIVKDDSFEVLMKSGRPSATLPSPRQVGRDVHTAFHASKKNIATLLQEYNGQLSFTTDTWTSPNHRAIVAWTVHLHHEGKPLSFLLDIVELPEVRQIFSFCNSMAQ